MDDLKPEERDALIRALESDGEIFTGSIEPPGPPFLWEYGGAADWFLTPAGTILAKSIKRERELDRAFDKAMIAVLGLDAKCRANSVDPGDYYDIMHDAYVKLNGPFPPPPEPEQ